VYADYLMKDKVAIVGAGPFGRAIAHLLENSKVGHLSLWDKDTALVPDQGSLEGCVSSASIVFLCVPSWAVREAATSIRDYISSQTIVISATKGIEEETLQTPEEVINDVLVSNQAIALLNGPMLAAEIRQGLPAFAVLAAKEKATFDTVAKLFVGSMLFLEYSSDIHGTALAGVLKNIYAIGLGMMEAMKLGSNFRGWYVERAAKEMAEIIHMIGGRATTAYNAAGLADLIATGFSPHSRNCRVGQELVVTGECKTVSEGAQSLPQVIALLKIKTKANQFPILEALAGIVIGKQDATTRFHQLLHRK
jgi:glycerol-3-phosphate dehydrogenase (NAD(P)+)